MARPRDNQRSRVYAFERATFFHGDDCHASPELPLRECAKLLMKVFKGKALPRIRDGRGARRGSSRTNEVTLPRFARRDWYVLHEAAHIMLARYYGMQSYEWHGAHFARVYAELVRKFTPQYTGVTANSLKAARVKVAPAAWYTAARKKGL